LTSRQLSIPLKVLQQESLILKHQYSKLKFPLEYWNETDTQIACDTVIYDGEVYKLDEEDFQEECLDYEIGKFTDNGYFERILNVSVR
jgi:hypothetical protein